MCVQECAARVECVRAWLCGMRCVRGAATAVQAVSRCRAPRPSRSRSAGCGTRCPILPAMRVKLATSPPALPGPGAGYVMGHSARQTHRHLAGAATSGPPGSCEGDSHAAGRVCVWRLTGGSGWGPSFRALLSGVVTQRVAQWSTRQTWAARCRVWWFGDTAGSREDRVEGTAATRFEEAL